MEERREFLPLVSGLAYIARLRRWKAAGYRIEINYLKLDDVRVARERIAARVRTGGHGVPEADVRRRFARSWRNFETHYQPLANAFSVFGVSGAVPVLLSTRP